MGNGPDFFGRAVTPVMSGLGNLAELHRSPSADTSLMGTIAEAIQRVFIRGGSGADEVGTVRIGGEGNQVASVAAGTLDAMADADRHRTTGVHVPSQQRRRWAENDEEEEFRREFTDSSYGSMGSGNDREIAVHSPERRAMENARFWTRGYAKP